MPEQLRYWDGVQWTSHIALRVEPTDVPVEAEPVSTADEKPGPGRVDLALNSPGQALADMADQIRQASADKSFFARLFSTKREERAWRRGRAGEIAVAKRLAGLGPDWRVLHSVPAGKTGRDIDHLVIGPPGVFSLNTKNHHGKRVWVAERTFMVNGHKTDYLPKSHREGVHAGKVLSKACGFDVAVEPVIVIIAADFNVKGQPPDVHVVGRKRIAKWLLRRPPCLTPEGVEIVYEQARWSTTWRSDRSPSTQP